MCSPRSGGAVRIAPGRRGEGERDARPGAGRRRRGARPRRTSRGPRPRATSNAASTSADRAGRDVGGLERRRASRRSARVASRSAMIGRSASRLVDPVAVRGEARVVGEVGQAERRAAARPLPFRARPPRRSGRRPSRTSRTGRCSGGRCRAGPGRSPVTKAFWAWLTRTASVDPSSDTSTRWPGVAVAARQRAPTRIPMTAYSPVTTSLMATPTLVGLAAVRVRVAGDRHEPARPPG